jgi:hypothetical protein
MASDMIDQMCGISYLPIIDQRYHMVKLYYICLTIAETLIGPKKPLDCQFHETSSTHTLEQYHGLKHGLKQYSHLSTQKQQY